MPIADMHCHLGMYVDPTSVMARASAAQVDIVVATCRPSEYRGLLGHASSTVTIGLGLHPEIAGSVHADPELRLFEHLIDQAGWVCEVGLDAVIADGVSSYFGAQPTLSAQRELLATALQLGGSQRCYSVHSRGAAEETLDLLSEYGCPHVVLHSFSGSVDATRRAVDAGYYFSIQPSMLETAEGAALVGRLPISRILLETDGPYYSFDGAQIEPAHCPDIAERIAAVRGMSPGLFAEIVIANTKTVLNWASPTAEGKPTGATDQP